MIWNCFFDSYGCFEESSSSSSSSVIFLFDFLKSIQELTFFFSTDCWCCPFSFCSCSLCKKWTSLLTADAAASCSSAAVPRGRSEHPPGSSPSTADAAPSCSAAVPCGRSELPPGFTAFIKTIRGNNFNLHTSGEVCCRIVNTWEYHRQLTEEDDRGGGGGGGFLKTTVTVKETISDQIRFLI